MNEVGMGGVAIVSRARHEMGELIVVIMEDRKNGDTPLPESQPCVEEP